MKQRMVSGLLQHPIRRNGALRTRWIVTTTGTTDPNWEPGEEDWKRLAELFRG